MLGQWSGHLFIKDMFGYIKFSGTDTSIAMAHELGNFVVHPLFYALLCFTVVLMYKVLLYKAIDTYIIPKSYWALLYYWYQRASVSLKSKNILGTSIEV